MQKKLNCQNEPTSYNLFFSILSGLFKSIRKIKETPIALDILSNVPIEQFEAFLSNCPYAEGVMLHLYAISA